MPAISKLLQDAVQNPENWVVLETLPKREDGQRIHFGHPSYVPHLDTDTLIAHLRASSATQQRPLGSIQKFEWVHARIDWSTPMGQREGGGGRLGTRGVQVEESRAKIREGEGKAGQSDTRVGVGFGVGFGVAPHQLGAGVGGHDGPGGPGG